MRSNLWGPLLLFPIVTDEDCTESVIFMVDRDVEEDDVLFLWKGHKELEHTYCLILKNSLEYLLFDFENFILNACIIMCHVIIHFSYF